MIILIINLCVYCKYFVRIVINVNSYVKVSFDYDFDSKIKCV